MRGRDGGGIICGTDFSKSICKVIPHKKYSSPNFARIKQRPKNTKTNNFKHLNLNSRVKSGDIDTLSSQENWLVSKKNFFAD